MDGREKFTGKADEYRKYRPDYPQSFIHYLRESLGMGRDSIVADVGAGTGILTRQLGEHVQQILAVEPNPEMRAACETYCRDLINFTAVDGSAEDSGLPEGSVDLITVAQAFHWFDQGRAKREFQRILKPAGRAVLVWNRREPESELIQAIGAVCSRTCPGFNGFSGGMAIRPDAYAGFFAEGRCDYQVFDNHRLLTRDSFIGGNLSASYAPTARDGNYQPFIQALAELFDRYSDSGRLLWPIRTHSFAGRV
jgi:SAM-dependent methyltransferase